MTVTGVQCGKNEGKTPVPAGEIFDRRKGKIIVLGLGNTLVSDDGAGVKAARLLQARLKDPRLVVEELAAGGMYLVEALVGYEAALLIDAFKTEGKRYGELYQLDISRGEEPLSSSGVSFTHGMGLKKALDLARFLDLPLPGRLEIYGIGVKDTLHISEECTPAVERALPDIADTLAERVKTIMKDM